MPRTNELLSL